MNQHFLLNYKWNNILLFISEYVLSKWDAKKNIIFDDTGSFLLMFKENIQNQL